MIANLCEVNGCAGKVEEFEQEFPGGSLNWELRNGWLVMPLERVLQLYLKRAEVDVDEMPLALELPLQRRVEVPVECSAASWWREAKWPCYDAYVEVAE